MANYREVTGATDTLALNDEVVNYSRAGAVAITLPLFYSENIGQIFTLTYHGAANTHLTIQTPVSGGNTGYALYKPGDATATKVTLSTTPYPIIKSGFLLTNHTVRLQVIESVTGGAVSFMLTEEDVGSALDFKNGYASHASAIDYSAVTTPNELTAIQVVEFTGGTTGTFSLPPTATPSTGAIVIVPVGRTYLVKNSNTNLVTITAAGTNTVDGAATVDIGPDTAAFVTCTANAHDTGGTWRVVKLSGPLTGEAVAVTAKTGAAPSAIAATDQIVTLSHTALGTVAVAAASGFATGQDVLIANIGTAPYVIDANASETINGDLTAVLLPGQSGFLTKIGTTSFSFSSIQRVPTVTALTGATPAIAPTHDVVTLSHTALATATLPATATFAIGQEIKLINIGTGITIIDPDAGDTINGDTTALLLPGQSAVLRCTSATTWQLTGGEVVPTVTALTGATPAITAVHEVVTISHTALATATLPATNTFTIGQKIQIINIGTAPCVIDADSTDTINGATTYTLNPGESGTLLVIGATAWAFIGQAKVPVVAALTGATPAVAVTHDVVTVSHTAGMTVTLPATAGFAIGQKITISNICAFPCTIDADGANTINGVTTVLLPPYSVGVLTCTSATTFIWSGANVNLTQLTHGSTNASVDATTSVGYISYNHVDGGASHTFTLPAATDVWVGRTWYLYNAEADDPLTIAASDSNVLVGDATIPAVTNAIVTCVVSAAGASGIFVINVGAATA